MPAPAVSGLSGVSGLVTSGPSASLYAATVLADTPQGYWRLGEASGNALDSSGNGRTGTVSGGVTQGQAGALPGNGCYLFDGVDGTRVRVVGLVVPAVYSIECWVNAAVGPVDRGLAGCWRTSQGAFLWIAPGSGFFAAAHNGSPHLTGTLGLNGQWRHVVSTYDGTTLRLYVDGVENTNAARAALVTPAATDFEIGTYAQDTGINFTGRIDEVALYGTALSPARVQAHYNAGIGA